MKLSKVMHVVSVLVGLSGVVMLLGAWNAGENGATFGFNQAHLFMDTFALMLVAIWMQVGVIHHMKLEEKGEMI
ncbi:MAG: hypothetical protein M3Q34_01545 [bacterium]|nr:hypothetical protein [bacterium]